MSPLNARAREGGRPGDLQEQLAMATAVLFMIVGKEPGSYIAP